MIPKEIREFFLVTPHKVRLIKCSTKEQDVLNKVHMLYIFDELAEKFMQVDSDGIKLTNYFEDDID